MAVIVNTDRPEILRDSLISLIRQAIITTWIVDSEEDITIRNPAWNSKAWFKIFVDNDRRRVNFGIITSSIFPMTKELYGVYHGRLAATLLANFDELILDIELTSFFQPEIDVFG